MIEQNDTQQMPAAVASEKLIIGSCLIDNSLITEVEAVLRPDDFFALNYKVMISALYDMNNRGISIDPVSLYHELESKEAVIQMGGLSGMLSLTQGIPLGMNIDNHVKLVKDRSIARQIVKKCSDAVASIMSQEMTTQEVLDSTEAHLYELRDTNESQSFKDIAPLVIESLTKAQQLSSGEATLVGIPSDFVELDQKLLGFQDTDLVILAARPSVGKTSLGLSLAQNMSIRNNKRVAFFSLEMSAGQLINRVICSEARVSNTRFRTGTLTDEEWDRIKGVSHMIAQCPLHINDSPAITTAFIKSELRRLSKLHKKVDIVMIDYLQLIVGPRRSENRTQEVSQISRELKQIAKEFNVPVIAMSQLNRQSENRANHRPTLADLRESGSIEQDADIVMFIFREDLYLPDPTSHTNIAEIIIAKNRNGPIGSVALRFDPNLTAFSNYIQDF